VVDPYDPEGFRAAGHAVIDQLADYLAGTATGEGPVLRYAPPEASLNQWPSPLEMDQRVPLADLLPQVIAGSHHIHHPRYVGHQVSAPIGSAALAELVSAVLNNGTAEFEMGPVSNAMEKRLLEWLGSALGFGPDVEGLFTSGGSAGNLTALAAARQSVVGIDAWNDGLAGKQPLAILTSEQAHYSNDRAARILGFGAGGVVPVAVDDRFRLDPARLREAHRRAEDSGRRVFAVVGSACSTATGAFDPLEPIADYAAEHGLWFHVDGAHGAVAALAPAYRHLVAGIERADSVVLDAHKMLLMPALVTAVLYRRPGAADRAFHQEQSYVGFDTHGGAFAWWDSGLRTLECTKRMMALELYASLLEHGPSFFADHVTRTFDLAGWFARELEAAADFELATEPQANIVCFRFTPDGVLDLDALQLAVRDELVRSGAFYVVKTRLRGRVHLRTTIINARTDEADLRALMEAIRAAANPGADSTRGGPLVSGGAGRDEDHGHRRIRGAHGSEELH
jgi:L-2,4-diaminobutyrate decarboxylase